MLRDDDCWNWNFLELCSTLAPVPIGSRGDRSRRGTARRQPKFARLWERYDVRAAPTLTKTFRHLAVGQITLDRDSLALTDRDQHLVLYTALKGSRDAGRDGATVL